MTRSQGAIHYVSRRFPKLTETFVVEEVLALEASGERVIVDSLEPPLDEPRHPGLARLDAPIRYVPVTPRRSEVARAHLALLLQSPMAWLRAAWRARTQGIWPEFRLAVLVARRSRAEGARHLHTHFAYYCADVGGLAAQLSGLPFSVTAHANDIWQVNNAPHLERRLGAADAVVTVTEYNADHIRGVVAGTPLHVVPCSVGPAESSPAPDDGPLLCVARLAPKKGVDVLIEALALLAPEHQRLRLELIGEGDLKEELRALARRRGLDERLAFRGAQPPQVVQEAYEGCSVFSLPCRIARDGDRDGLPVVLLEALARGLPVVTTDVGGISEVVRHRITGLVVPPEDPQALAAAIAELRADRALARRLGDEGRKLVRERHSHESRAEAMTRIFAARAGREEHARPQKTRHAPGPPA
jgi:glycosyltransferase involved in cell wall biosynthesis